MDAATIFAVLASDAYSSSIFHGVFGRESLFHLNPTFPSGYVINTHSSQRENWLAIYYDKSGTAHLFDSLAQPFLQRDFKIFLRHTALHTIFNRTQLQSPNSSTSGHYCIIFLLLCARGYSMNEIVSAFHENPNRNDLAVKIFINQHIKIPLTRFPDSNLRWKKQESNINPVLTIRWHWFSQWAFLKNKHERCVRYFVVIIGHKAKRSLTHKKV